MNLHIRQQKKPYKNFWEVDFNASKEWKQRKLFIKLQARGHSAFNKTKLDSSRLVLYLSLKNGVTDIAYIELKRMESKANPSIFRIRWLHCLSYMNLSQLHIIIKPSLIMQELKNKTCCCFVVVIPICNLRVSNVYYLP